MTQWQHFGAAITFAGAILLCPAPAAAAPDPGEAAFIFSEAKEICDRDGGSLWGQTLCGPIMLVDPADRAVVANQADPLGKLKPEGSHFVGRLPDQVILSNSPTDWEGVRWTQILWPPNSETMIRRVFLAHELFHRIQPALGLSRPEAPNHHLDTLEGRYLVQLEGRALARALTAGTKSERMSAIDDAILFRRERHRLFPAAALEEHVTETNEGIPEYVGVRLGLGSSEERTAYAVYGLARFVTSPTLVRTFAYATGPAYGLLLDDVDLQWRAKFGAGRRFDELFGAANGPVSSERVKARSTVYDDGALRGSEVKREEARVQRMAVFKARLVDGPVLSLPLRKSKYRFNPQTLTPLDGFGTIYPTMQLTDDWGTLVVEEGGALVRSPDKVATVSARSIDASNLVGDGWKVSLKPGWVVQSGPREGDYQVIQVQ